MNDDEAYGALEAAENENGPTTLRASLEFLKDHSGQVVTSILDIGERS